jgi:hypothetical protein
LSTEDLARANGLANNVVIDGKYITQPYIYWNGTVSGPPIAGKMTCLMTVLQGTLNPVPVILGSMRDDG